MRFNVLFIVSIISTLLLSVALTLAVRKVVTRKGLVALPRKDRWHQKPTAMLGGIAIYVAFVVGYLFLAPTLPHSYAILIAGTVLFLVGLVDDIYQLKPYTKSRAEYAN